MYTQIGILMLILYFIADSFPKNINIYYKKLLLFSLIFLFWWVGGLAYKLGIDNYHYELFYYLQKNGDYEYFEIGYKFINKLFYKLNLNFYVFKGSLYFLLVILIYKGIKEFFPNKEDLMLSFIFIFLYGSFYYLYISFIRQAIALSIFIFSLQYIYKKKKIKYLVLIIIACFFHKTSIILYPLYYLFNNLAVKKIIIKNQNIVLILIFLMKVLLVKLSAYKFLQVIISKISIFIPRIQYYLEYIPANSINIYDILVLCIIFINKFFKPNYSKKEKELLKYFIIIYSIFSLLNGFSFMIRFKMYIDIFFILNIVLILNKCQKVNKYNKLLKYLFIIIFFIRFNIYIQKRDYIDSIFPYQNYSYKLFKEIKFEDTQQFLIVKSYGVSKIEEIINK